MSVPGTFKHAPFPVFVSHADGAQELVGGLDWLGNVFKVGDPVMYCVSAGRGQMMAIGRVVKLAIAELSYWQQQLLDRGQEVERELAVQVLTTRTSGHWGNGPRSRPAWVNAMNITALPTDWVVPEPPVDEEWAA